MLANPLSLVPTPSWHSWAWVLLCGCNFGDVFVEPLNSEKPTFGKEKLKGDAFDDLAFPLIYSAVP